MSRAEDAGGDSDGRERKGPFLPAQKSRATVHRFGSYAHAPLVQVVPEPQTFPQVPQLLLSEDRSVQVPEQQAGVVPLVQAVPQAPQFLLLDARSAHLPEQQAGVVPVHTLPHLPQLLVCDRSTQVPPQQPGVTNFGLFAAHENPQVPQLFGSKFRLLQ